MEPTTEPDRTERAAALLWGEEPPRTRGPQPATSREEIVAAAVAVADVSGLDGLSMRAIAESLGIGTMSLYRYVPGKNELVALMVDAVWGETTPQLDGGTWRAQMEELARLEWDMYHRHPWMLSAPLGRTAPGPMAARKYEANLAAALRTGLPLEEVARCVWAIDHLVVGTAKASTENAAFVAETGVTVVEWWERQEDIIGSAITAGDYPTLRSIVEAGAFHSAHSAARADAHDGFTDDFEYALGLALDGLEARVARQSGPGR